ncbi:hypothetical protein T492DRAFT_912841, partial [Pavlovales sp. CCMP2436]
MADNIQALVARLRRADGADQASAAAALAQQACCKPAALALYLLPLASTQLVEGEYLQASYAAGGTFPPLLFTPTEPSVNLVVELYLRETADDNFDVYVDAGSAVDVENSLDLADEATLAAARYSTLEPVDRRSGECTTGDGTCAYYALYLPPCDVAAKTFALVVARRDSSTATLAYSLRFVTAQTPLLLGGTQPEFNTSASDFAHPLNRWLQRTWAVGEQPVTVSLGWQGTWAPRQLLLLVRRGACPTLREFDFSLSAAQEEFLFPLCPCGAPNSTNAPLPPP